jgi:hypothetical protein
VEILNRGTRAVYVDLTSAVRDESLHLELPTGIGVPPGRQAVGLRVRARVPLVGAPREIPFWVNVTPEGGTTPAATAEGVRVVRARLLVWQLVALLVGVVLVLAVIGAVVAFAGGSGGAGYEAPVYSPSTTYRAPGNGGSSSGGSGGRTTSARTTTPRPATPPSTGSGGY